ncbi:Bifunctional glutamine synthetase adenylyltransferase/adenylyl-removing enzyme [Trichinella spiralis]|uniref:Bifunctional glutamine synthetase adenylyltransferase/adenylyl-removing enzyme n=1 Tax=Trichinella spiralis TaxID=6334 RepID=A0ABR3KGF8_TRISP
MRTMQSDTAAPSRAYSVFFSLYASSIDYRWNPSLPGSTAERQQLCPVASASSRSAAFRLLLPRLLLMHRPSCRLRRQQLRNTSSLWSAIEPVQISHNKNKAALELRREPGLRAARDVEDASASSYMPSSSFVNSVDLRRGIEQKAWKRNLPSLLASGGGAKLVVVEIDQLNGPVLRLHTVQNWLHKEKQQQQQQQQAAKEYNVGGICQLLFPTLEKNLRFWLIEGRPIGVMCRIAS